MIHKLYKLAYKYSIASDTNQAAGFVFISPEDKTLFLVQRAPNVSEANTWATVGGGVEEGETFFEAAQREVVEELGEMPQLGKVFGYIDFEQGDFIYRTFFATITNKDEWKITLNPENSDYGWFSVNEMPQPLHKNFATTLKRVHII